MFVCTRNRWCFSNSLFTTRYIQISIPQLSWSLCSNLELRICFYPSKYIHTCIYIYTYVHVYIYIWFYIHIYITSKIWNFNPSAIPKATVPPGVGRSPCQRRHRQRATPPPRGDWHGQPGCPGAVSASPDQRKPPGIYIYIYIYTYIHIYIYMYIIYILYGKYI